ncbi:MAG: branched-chain amino acid ABC transporter permease [Pseudomonadota bacterium]
MTAALLFEQLLNGLILGSMYALLGSGVSLIYGTMRVLNFAHGEFYMLGGYFMFFLVTLASFHPALAGVVAVLGVFVVAAAFQRTALAKIMRGPDMAFGTIAVTLGLAYFLQNLALTLWGENFQSVPYYVTGTMVAGDIRLPWQRILIFAVAVGVLLAMAAMLKWSRLGLAIRATSQQREAAEVVGIPAARVHMITFAMACALGAIAAVMLAPIFAVSPWMGMPQMLKAFVVVILGGLGSFPGAIVAGLMLGVIEAFGITFTSSEWRDVIAFGILILVIWVRPNGLFSSELR